MPTAIIFGAESKSIRRIVTDTATVEELRAHVGPGEDLILVGEGLRPSNEVRTVDRDDAELYFNTAAGLRAPALPECNQIVLDVTGVEPADTRCVVLGPDFEVVRVVLADPLLDAVEDGDIVRDEEAIPGDVLASDGVFYRTAEAISADSIAAKAMMP